MNKSKNGLGAAPEQAVLMMAIKCAELQRQPCTVLTLISFKKRQSLTFKSLFFNLIVLGS